jgi:hypothetical protein
VHKLNKATSLAQMGITIAFSGPQVEENLKGGGKE